MSTVSRIGVIQPQRPGAFLGERAEQEPDVFNEHGARLDLSSPDFDPDLKRRVIAEYAQHLCGLLRRAGEVGCDIVLLPECCLPIGSPTPAGRERMPEVCAMAEEIWLDLSAPVAREFDLIIASCYYRSEGDKLYNDAVLMDGAGQIAGIYHKVHLPCPLDQDMTEAGVFEAGDEHPVFPTRIGSIGFQICYDIDFPEGCRCLALNGADLILHPTVGYNFPDEEEVVAEARLRTRATDSTVALAYANFGPSPGRSAIYASNGNQVACAGRGVDSLVFADLDLKQPRAQSWDGDTSYEDHRERLARKRRPDTYGVLVESRPPALANTGAPDGRLYDYAPEVGLE